VTRSASHDSSSRLGSPIRTNLDPIQEMQIPPAVAPKPVKQSTTISLPTSNGGLTVTPTSHLNNNNNNKNGGGPVHRRRESIGSSRSRPTTPSGRDVRALNLSNLSKSNPTVEMPTEQASPADLMNSMDKKVRPKSFWASWWRF
jgi:hypothetical protein